MNRLTDKKGFSMLEILVAMTILGIGIMGLATLQSRGIRGNDLGNRTSQATAMAQDKLEELINADAIGQAIAAGTENNLIDEKGETGNAGSIFSRSWAIQIDVPAPDEDTIAITVSWNDVIGQHNVTASGVITSDSY